MEEIKFSCPHCGVKLGSPPRGAGRKVDCPGCREPIRIPEASRVEDPAPNSGQTPFPAGILAIDMKFLCPACAASLLIDARAAGCSVTCPLCKQALSVPRLPPSLRFDPDLASRPASKDQTFEATLSEEEIEFLISFGADDSAGADSPLLDTVFSE